MSADGGIASGDIIVAVDDEAVDSVSELVSRPDDFRVGETVTVTILREGAKRDAPVTLQPEV